MFRSLHWHQGQKEILYRIESLGKDRFQITFKNGGSYQFQLEQYKNFLLLKGDKRFWANSHQEGVSINATRFSFSRNLFLKTPSSQSSSSSNEALTPMPGKILKIFVQKGEKIQAGDPLFSLEAMKMEQTVNAPRSGVVIKILFQEGDLVEAKKKVVELEQDS